jgi:hypothetical protein
MCPDCQSAKETNGLWTQFNTPQCPYCTARLIQRIGRLRTPTTDAITARRRVVLSDALVWGHSEEKIRALAKGPLAVAP